MPPPAPDYHCGPVRWTWRAHPRGTPAEAVAWDWLAPRIVVSGNRLQDCQPSLTRNAHGRPLIAAGDGRHDASWSHSGDMLLIALGEHVDVGVDVEQVKPHAMALELARRYFTPDETAWLEVQTVAARDTTFVRLWCAKEAVLKAHGRGLAFGLHRLGFVEHAGVLRLMTAAPELGSPEAWSLHEFMPRPGYHAALAWRKRG